MKMIYKILIGLGCIGLSIIGFYAVNIINTTGKKVAVFKAGWTNLPNKEICEDHVTLFEYKTEKRIINLCIDEKLRTYLNSKGQDDIKVEVSIGGRWWTSWILVPVIDGEMYNYTNFTILDRGFLNEIKK